jgi:hypothetical protein
MFYSCQVGDITFIPAKLPSLAPSSVFTQLTGSNG